MVRRIILIEFEIDRVLTPDLGIANDVSALVSWANGNCANAQGWECAEFTARAIAAGGYIPGLRHGHRTSPTR